MESRLTTKTSKTPSRHTAAWLLPILYHLWLLYTSRGYDRSDSQTTCFTCCYTGTRSYHQWLSAHQFGCSVRLSLGLLSIFLLLLQSLLGQRLALHTVYISVCVDA